MGIGLRSGSSWLRGERLMTQADDHRHPGFTRAAEWRSVGRAAPPRGDSLA